MPQSLCNFLTNTGSQTRLLLLQPEALMMPQYPPVEVGTRGTVGSLLKREIEYFRRLEPGNSRDRPGKNRSKMKDMGCSASGGGGKKKQGSSSSSSSKMLPSMCSMVDVSDHMSRPHNGSGGTSAFSYRNLKLDTKNSQI